MGSSLSASSPVTHQAEGTQPEPLCDTRAAALFFGHTIGWVQRNVRPLSIPHYRVGGHLRFRLSELATWVDAQGVK